ncbi:MAG: ATP-binding protein, partial [Polyangiaceae bacterium]
MGGSIPAELQAALDELAQVRESEARFRNLAERASDLISRTDPGGRCIYISPSCRDLLGYEPEEIVGKLALIDLAHPDDVREQQQVLARFVQGKTSGSPLMRRLRRKDGTYVWLEIITHIERDAEGKIVEVQSWARDVTSRVLAEQALARAEAEQKKMEQRLALAERMAIVGRLASGVGHEVNNPLAYILGSLELARADLAALSADVPSHPCIPRLDRHLVTVREGAERVRDIVRDLKSLSFATDDRLGPVDVERALDLAAATAAHEIRLRARLVKRYAGIGLAEANEGRLAQVFVNLLVNAAQAIPEGAASDNEIRIVTREESGTVVVEIHDSGTGIAPDDLPRVFEPFFTTKPKGIGTGLGLSISHTIVSALGGTLTAEPASPRGALFRVTLRRSYEALARPPSSASRATRARA